MGLTSALNTSLNGLALNELAIDVLGNNIANASTTGFKASNVQFMTQLSRTLSVGSRATDSNGGTNPRQVGLGATTAAIQKDFSSGSISNSTSPSDFAIQGDGFFIVAGSEGTLYTRNGNFLINSNNQLVNSQGLLVQGYSIDEDYNIVTTQLTDINIPLGSLNVAERTEEVFFNGALNPNGEIGTQGALIVGDAMLDSTAGPGPATGGSLLSNVTDGSGTALFAVGETVTFNGRKGDRTQASNSLPVTALTTVNDLLALMDNTLGIHSGGTIPSDGTTGAQPGVAIVGGQIQITGNRGTANDLTVSLENLLISNGGTNQPVGLNFTKQQSANGESALTDFLVYDSLGQALTVRLSATLESNTSSSTTFRYFLESQDDSDLDFALGNGTLVYDGEGRLSSGAQQTFAIDRNSTAALSPMQITADFSAISGIASGQSRLGLVSQDGSPPGTLVNFITDEKGVINGIFDNGVTRPLGQLALARFANNQGLIENGSSTFRQGISSGTAFHTVPGDFGAGTLRSGAIELSNTDIGRNLVDLILASTNYRGNARVISSVQQLVDELLLLGR
jgi:flagellar hook protein FlgE